MDAFFRRPKSSPAKATPPQRQQTVEQEEPVPADPLQDHVERVGDAVSFPPGSHTTHWQRTVPLHSNRTEHCSTANANVNPRSHLVASGSGSGSFPGPSRAATPTLSFNLNPLVKTISISSDAAQTAPSNVMDPLPSSQATPMSCESSALRSTKTLDDSRVTSVPTLMQRSYSTQSKFRAIVPLNREGSKALDIETNLIAPRGRRPKMDHSALPHSTNGMGLGVGVGGGGSRQNSAGSSVGVSLVSPDDAVAGPSSTIIQIPKETTLTSPPDTSSCPTSDENARISISSTVYPSSERSYSPQTYFHRIIPSGSQPPQHPSLQSSSIPDRESFIDFLSPTSPNFGIHTQDSHDNTSPTISTAHNGQRSSPDYHLHPDNEDASSDTSEVSLSSMIFAPPSPVLLMAADSPSSPPKWVSRRASSAQPSKRKSHAHPPLILPRRDPSVPPTTNLLDASERADLVRKTRKLAQVFGKTPGADILVHTRDDAKPKASLTPDTSQTLLNAWKSKGHRNVVSIAVPLANSGPIPALSPRWLSTSPAILTERRHSSPSSPEVFTFFAEETRAKASKGRRERPDSKGLDVDRLPFRSASSDRPPSPTSFIDLSEDDAPHDGQLPGTHRWRSSKSKRQSKISLTSTAPSFVTMPPEEQAEAERRRKREQLAKLHRFLGSRVPPDLVIGSTETSPSQVTSPRYEEGAVGQWPRRRRSSSTGALPMWLDPLDRNRDELGVREKAINVRRAQKMEKVFGEPPPQTLYHTRHFSSLSPVNPASAAAGTSAHGGDVTHLPQRNANQSAYVKPKGKSYVRHRSSESVDPLLPHDERDSADSEAPGYAHILAQSAVYLKYQHSLNSLTDIIARDDRESLAELHRYLHGDALEPSEPQRTDMPRISTASSDKSERRHSLPPSIISMSSESAFTITEPESSDFQRRRKRAAKLTQFFGVNHRELIRDVLESIEKGVEEERKRGTLEPEEVEVLLHKLRNLRVKRNGLGK